MGVSPRRVAAAPGAGLLSLMLSGLLVVIASTSPRAAAQSPSFPVPVPVHHLTNYSLSIAKKGLNNQLWWVSSCCYVPRDALDRGMVTLSWP